MSTNNDYATGNLLDYEYFSKHYKLIARYYSKQVILENPDLKQQINFIGKLEEDNITMLLVIERSEQTTLDVLQNSVTVVSFSLITDYI